MTNKITINYTDINEVRMDQFIADHLSMHEDLPTITRSQIKQIIESGNVTINGAVTTKAGYKISCGNVILVNLPEPEIELTPWDHPINIVYEDDSLAVIDKPSGLTVHPGAGNKTKTLVNILVHRYGQAKLGGESSFRPGIVHRLDKDTTGLLVVTKNAAAHSSLAKQFSDRTVDRLYLALVRTLPRASLDICVNENGRIETNIGRHHSKRTMMSVLVGSGQRAVTNWRVIERFHYGSLLELKLETGRTHQIRVHMDHMGTPIIGDTVYGDFNMLPKGLLNAARKFSRQALHAAKLGFTHPVTNEKLVFNSQPDAKFMELVDVFRNYR